MNARSKLWEDVSEIHHSIVSFFILVWKQKQKQSDICAKAGSAASQHVVLSGHLEPKQKPTVHWELNYTDVLQNLSLNTQLFNASPFELHWKERVRRCMAAVTRLISVFLLAFCTLSVV